VLLNKVLCPSLKWQTKFQTHINIRANCNIIYSFQSKFQTYTNIRPNYSIIYGNSILTFYTGSRQIKDFWLNGKKPTQYFTETRISYNVLVEAQQELQNNGHQTHITYHQNKTNRNELLRFETPHPTKVMD